MKEATHTSREATTCDSLGRQPQVAHRPVRLSREATACVRTNRHCNNAWRRFAARWLGGIVSWGSHWGDKNPGTYRDWWVWGVMRLLRIAVVDLNIEYRARSDEQKKEKNLQQGVHAATTSFRSAFVTPCSIFDIPRLYF